MPYLAEQNKAYFDDLVKQLKKTVIANGGELNFLVAQLVSQYFVTHSKNYAAINEVMGALESTKLEFYRRVAAPYEDQKIELNGEAYGEETLR